MQPPPVLALHLNRSMHYGHYAAKNNCRVSFPEILDLTPYTTSGQLSTQPSAPISSPPPPIPIQRSITPTPSTYAVPRTLYRLSAVVCHYGQHSFGHYVCFRRKPRPPAAGDHRYAPPRLACPLGCDCQRCQQYGPIRDDEWPDSARPGTGRGWLRISDDSVQEVGIERVLQEGSGTFMLYYERVQQPRSLYATPPRGSEETVRPDEAHANTADVGAKTSSTARIPDGEARDRERKERREDRERSVDPRVVRRVSAGRSSSARQTSTPVPPPMSRSTSGSSAVTAASTFSQSSQSSQLTQSSQKTVNGDTGVSNGHAHSHHSHHSNGHADQASSQRPPLPPSSPSKSGRLRKTRRSVSHADGNPVSPTQGNPPSTSLRA